MRTTRPTRKTPIATLQQSQPTPTIQSTLRQSQPTPTIQPTRPPPRHPYKPRSQPAINQQTDPHGDRIARERNDPRRRVRSSRQQQPQQTYAALATSPALPPQHGETTPGTADTSTMIDRLSVWSATHRERDYGRRGALLVVARSDIFPLAFCETEPDGWGGRQMVLSRICGAAWLWAGFRMVARGRRVGARSELWRGRCVNALMGSRAFVLVVVVAVMSVCASPAWGAFPGRDGDLAVATAAGLSWSCPGRARHARSAPAWSCVVIRRSRASLRTDGRSRSSIRPAIGRWWSRRMDRACGVFWARR